MSHLGVTMNLDTTPWLDLKDLNDDKLGTLTRIGLLPHGMISGATSVAMVIDLPDGSQVIAQTSWKMLKMAVHAFEVSPVTAEFLQHDE